MRTRPKVHQLVLLGTVLVAGCHRAEPRIDECCHVCRPVGHRKSAGWLGCGLEDMMLSRMATLHVAQDLCEGEPASLGPLAGSVRCVCRGCLAHEPASGNNLPHFQIARMEDSGGIYAWQSEPEDQGAEVLADRKTAREQLMMCLDACSGQDCPAGSEVRTTVYLMGLEKSVKKYARLEFEAVVQSTRDVVIVRCVGVQVGVTLPPREHGP